VVVTGGGHGIGRATSSALAARGATVVVAGLDEPALADVARQVGGSWCVADVRDPAHADDLVKHALDVHGRLDAVVANAGIGHAGPVAQMSADRICDLVDINVRGPMLLAQAALPTLIAQSRGSLVFLTSIAGRLLVDNEAVYSATKAAIEAFAVPLRDELRSTGVTVSTIAPGVVATAFFDGRGAPYERRVPRPMPPDRVAHAIVQAIETGRAHTTVPRWLDIPTRINAVAPGLYRRLARRFG
jgi:NADP-dependent 3-hydroxy acid dehydrogenase YdfG